MPGTTKTGPYDQKNPKKSLVDFDVSKHNAKRHHGTDINNEVYQVQGDSRKYQSGYDNVIWDK